MSGADSPPPSFRYFIAGTSESGKTTRMMRDVLVRVPRLILLDQTGEWNGRPAVNGGRLADAESIGELFAVMRELAKYDRWQIVAVIDEEELEELRQRLMPRGRLRQGPAVKLGGITLALDEVDMIIGPGASPLRDLWRRGRHAGLSIASGSQKLSDVSKQITSQSSVIAIMALHEVNDVQYLRSLMGAELADEALEWVNGAPYRVAYWSPRSRAIVKSDGKK